MNKPRFLFCTLSLCACAALSDPGLTGSWNGSIDGTAISLTLDGRGGGQVDGRPIRYQVQGQVLLIEDQGRLAMYQFELKGNQLRVAGGQLPGVLTMSRGAAARAPAAPAAGGSAGLAQALVGKWCKVTNFTANSGGSQSSNCFELRGNGTYGYNSERSSSGAYGGTAGSSADSGRWSATRDSITAHSSSGQVNTYRLELRNHPKNGRDPMICLDGQCYVSWYQKPPW